MVSYFCVLFVRHLQILLSFQGSAITVPFMKRNEKLNGFNVLNSQCWWPKFLSQAGSCICLETPLRWTSLFGISTRKRQVCWESSPQKPKFGGIPSTFFKMQAHVIRCGFTNTCHCYAGSPSRSSFHWWNWGAFERNTQRGEPEQLESGRVSVAKRNRLKVLVLRLYRCYRCICRLSTTELPRTRCTHSTPDLPYNMWPRRGADSAGTPPRWWTTSSARMGGSSLEAAQIQSHSWWKFCSRSIDLQCTWNAWCTTWASVVRGDLAGFVSNTI